MIKMKRKLLIIINLLFVVACVGGGAVKDLGDVKNIAINYGKLCNCIKITNNDNTFKVDLQDKNIIKGGIFYFVNNNDLFIISSSKSVIKISLKNQNIDWIKEMTITPYNNFVFDEENIYFNGIDNNFYILDYESGNIKGMFFNTNINTIFNIKQPYAYKNYIVAFFANNEIFIINRLTNKIVKTIEYDNIDIKNNIITIDGNKTINLNNLKDK